MHWPNLLVLQSRTLPFMTPTRFVGTTHFFEFKGDSIKIPQGQRLCGLTVEPGRVFFRIWALDSRRIRLKAACRFKQFREGRLRLCSCHVLPCPMDGDCTIGSACGHCAGCGQTSSRRPQPVTVWRRLQSSLRHDQCSRRAVGHRVYAG